MNRLRVGFLLGIVALLALTFFGTSAQAEDSPHEPELVVPPGGGVVPPPEVQIQVVEVEEPPPAGSPIHPSFALLDEDGRNVLDTGGAVSTLTTCGTCHDTAFIADHNYHASVGLTAFTDPGDTASGRPWDTSNGLFGRWNPITYRYLSPSGDDLIDLGTADWISTIGTRHAGSGPAATSRSGYPLSDLAYVEGDPETNVLDDATGEGVPWDWSQSGVEEFNCFLCHVPTADNDARIRELEAGRFRWAGTATLAETGIVDAVGETWVWNPGAFTDDGDLAPEYMTIAKPSNEACGQCHGAVHEGDDPLVGSSLADGWETFTSGQVFSPQRVAESGLNLPDKDELARPWDVHAERGLDCVSCHGALNNPAQVAESDETKPDHLEYDPRRRDLGSYLEQPLHEFAKGHTAQGTVAPEYNHTMRTCADCHDPQDSHEWLPFQERHMAQVACETCHIPASIAPAAEQYDWTVIHTDGTPRTAVRGADGAVESADTLITGFDPVILQRIEEDGSKRLAPYNLVGSWFWAHGTPERPVRLIDLEAAYLEGDHYAPDVVAAFDGDGDGDISEGELAIDDDVKEELIRSRLAARGLEDPHIAAELQPYTIAHGITAGSWAIRDCQACHSSDSRLSQAMPVGAYVPGGVLPTFVGDSDTETTGSLHVTDDGRLWYEPETTSGDIEVLGNDRGGWADWIGFTVFMLVLIGIAIHGIIRVYTHYHRGPEHHTTRDAYLYTRYERFWHWTQALIIIMLILTGIVIHYPDAASAGTFRWMILVHNVLAVILVANAILALVDAVASGFIRQFLPRPAGFFHQAIVQATYYVQGIFRGDPHPYEKDERQKLNPLQQATYLAILNVLLPLQMITGILIWGAQRWPDVTSRLGGLGFLLPVHTLIAWLFAAFLVLHIYLTTTGVTPLASVRGMVTGWEEVEVQPADEDEQETEVVS